MEGEAIWEMPEGRRRARRVETYPGEETEKVREDRLWFREKPRNLVAMGWALAW
jgi:hypothetical protein